MKLFEVFTHAWPFYAGDASAQNPLLCEPSGSDEVYAFYNFATPLPSDPEDRMASMTVVAATESGVVVGKADFTYRDLDRFDVITQTVTVYPVKYLVRVDRIYRSRYSERPRAWSSEVSVSLVFSQGSGLAPFDPPLPPTSGDRPAHQEFCQALLRWG